MNNGPSPGHSSLLCLKSPDFLVVATSGQGPNFNNGPGNGSDSGCTLALQRLFESDLNNGSSPSYPNLVSDGVYICSGLLLMVSWWVPYLIKSCRPDFNNGLGGDSNSGPILGPRRLFESNSNNGPSPGHSNLVSDEVYICSSLPLMISWWLPSLAKGPTPDFNNGPGNALNSDVSKQIRLCTESSQEPRKQKGSWLTKI